MKPHILKSLLAVILLLPALCQASDLATPDGFKTAYLRAIEQKDLKQVEALVSWERVSDQFRDLWRQQRQRELGRKVTTAAIAPGADAFKSLAEFTLQGVTYRPNLPVTHTLTVKFDTSDGNTQGASVVAVGQKDGKFWITLAAPVAK